MGPGHQEKLTHETLHLQAVTVSGGALEGLYSLATQERALATPSRLLVLLVSALHQLCNLLSPHGAV